MGKIKDKVYHLMIIYLPKRFMYKHTSIDSQHKIWIPRFGWTKKEIQYAEKRAEEINNNINWK